MVVKEISGRKINELLGPKAEYIHTGIGRGSYNMEFDSERAAAIQNGESLPMIRFYGWRPWAVSLGYNQSDSDIDKNECEKLGYDLVRRPTGGRAVLHANEITYSAAMNLPEGFTAQDIYRGLHKILLEGIKILAGGRNISGEIGFEKSQPDFRNLYKDSGHSASCFASSARYEIEFKGRKIIGSAQRLFGKTLLQHGSILLGPGHETLADIVKLDTGGKRRALKKYILNHSATLSEAMGREINYKQALEAFSEGALK